MPRSGTTGTYSLPPNTDNQQPLTTISSAMFNAFAADVAQTFNDTLPIAFGGTNAVNVVNARANLGLNFYDGTLTLTPAEQGKMRANMGGDLLAGFRNKIINGDFDLWQRGTSATGVTTALSYGPDRWLIGTSGATVSWSRQNQVVGLTTVPGNPQYFCRLSVTSADDNVSISNTMPGVRTLAGRLVTVTAYLKSPTTAPSSLAVRLVQNFGTGGTPSSAVTTTVASGVSVTSSFLKYQWTVTVPSISGQTIGNNGDDYLRLTFINTVSQTFTLDLAHISVVEGDATAEADPFAARSISQETELCRYFYRKSYLLGTAPGSSSLPGIHGFLGDIGSGLASHQALVQLGTAMRVSPSVVIYSESGTAGQINAANLGPVSASATYISQYSFWGGATNSFGPALTPNETLLFHWTADAEFY